LIGVLHGSLNECAVICCHGLFSSKESTKHTRIANTLAQAGIATLRFDFAGSGESEGRIEDTTFTRRRDDLAAAIDYLAQRGAKRFGLFGSSMGGSVAILTAARDERVVAIATLAAVAHPGEIEARYPDAVQELHDTDLLPLPGGGSVGRDFAIDAPLHDPVAAAAIIHAPLLVLHGSRDEVVPLCDADDLATAARESSLLVVDGADHSFSGDEHVEFAVSEICGFLFKHLGA
jgi:pimeloyl-ACP methyl ester carboxylesterase